MKKICATLLLTAVISSCQTDDFNNPPDVAHSANTVTDKMEADKLLFSKAFAQALANKEFRELLKTEALKMFDKDYDIFYQSIKNKRLSSGIEVEDLIASYSLGKNELTRITTDNPMLTLFIPDLSKHSARNWDTENEIPTVAIRNVSDISKNGMMKTIDFKGEWGELSYKKDPFKPIIILKENERLTNKRSDRYGKLNSLNKDPHTAYLVNEIGDFAFWDNAFDSRISTPEKSARTNDVVPGGFYDNLLPEVREAWENNGTCHRDNVYYRILPEVGRNTGTYRPGYQEAITSIEFSDASMMYYIADDISDGNLEIQITALMTGSSPSSINPINKGLNCTKQDLFETYVDNNGILQAIKPKIHFPYRIPIIDWNMKTYGDTWKFTLQEIDPGTTTTTSMSITSTFGTNYTNSTKDGVGFGSSSTTSITSGYSFSISGGSDPLFDGILNYCTPILSSTGTVELPPNLGGGVYMFYRSGPRVETGYVKMVVEPVKIF